MSNHFITTLLQLKGFTLPKLGKALKLTPDARKGYITNPAKLSREKLVEVMLAGAGYTSANLTFLRIVELTEGLVPKEKVRDTALALSAAHSEDQLVELRPALERQITRQVEAKEPLARGSTSPLTPAPKPTRASLKDIGRE